MKKLKLLALIFVCIAMFAFSFTVSAQSISDGWYDNGNGTWSYYEYGEKVTNRFVYYEDDTYYLDGSGIMLSAEWYTHEDGNRYYFGADGKAYGYGIHKIGNAYYAFDYSGCLCVDGLREFYDDVEEKWFYCYAQASKGGALLTNDWKRPRPDWDGNPWYYFGADGKAYSNGIYKINGNFYAFDYSGCLRIDGFFEQYDNTKRKWFYYYAQAEKDGALLTNDWKYFQTEWDDNYWCYFGADGAAYTSNSYWIKDAYYAFNSNGRMLDNEETTVSYYNPETDTWEDVGVFHAKEGGKLYANEWYLDEYDNWYYYGAKGKAANGYTKVGGKYYLFNYWGRMLEDEAITVETSTGTKWYVADKNGNAYELFNNNWKQIGKYWYYVQNGELCQNDFYTIGGVTYYFGSDGHMYDDVHFGLSQYDDDDNYIGEVWYYAKLGGAIAKNEWIEIYDNDWYYYTADGTPHEPGLATIGGKLYYFEDDGHAIYNDIRYLEDGVYFFYKDCVGIKANGWAKCPHSYWEDEDDAGWMYVLDGDILCYGIYEIGGKKYAFDSEGIMLSNQTYWDYDNEVQYLLTKVNPDGSGGYICEQPGWQKTYHGYVYINADSTLYHGWLSDKYYLSPYMAYCDIIRYGDDFYAVNVDGICKKITSTGLFELEYYTVYLENGKAICEQWKWVSGGWRYFDYEGVMLINTRRRIDEKNYYFDSNGIMYNKGWIRSVDNDWYYANSDGSLYTGKDSVGYLFNSYGKLCVDEVARVNDVWYITNADGKVIKTLAKGWNQVNGDWYYIGDYYDEYEEDYYEYLYTDTYAEINGKCYHFDEKGRMISNRFYNSYYFGDDGSVSGWINVNNKWYYGDPEDDGYLYYDGIYTINGKEYFFKERILQQNYTGFYWYMLVTTDSEGRVIKETEVENGWFYDEEGSYGSVYYYKDGERYEGWVGDYYIDSGRLTTNDTVYDNGKWYYLQANGLCKRNGWVEFYENAWLYARADGSLYHNEWLWTGGKWYYFDGYEMYADGVLEIDGVKYVFNADGVNTGKVSSTVSDGWQKIGNDWYFFMAGEMVRGREIYDNGNWYYINHNGKMAANEFDYYKLGGLCYYLADGTRAKYTGWKYIKGNWCYFGSDHTIPYGWVLDGNTYYFQTDHYDAKTDSYSFGMVTGYYAIEDSLCYFGNDGKYRFTVTTNGWYKGGSDWYYIVNGRVLTNVREYKIGNAYYTFDYEGKMVANTVYDGRFYDASGKMVTTTGWRYVNKKWVYITRDGFVASYGIYKIAGVEYAFYDGYML